MPCFHHDYSVCSDAKVVSVEGSNVVKSDQSDGVGEATNVGGNSKTGDQFIKNGDGIEVSNFVPGVVNASEPSKNVVVLDERKFSEKQASSKEPKMRWNFKPIKKKQWKPFNRISLLNNELFEKRKKIAGDEQLKNSPTQKEEEKNSTNFLERKVKAQWKAQMLVIARKVSKKKKQKTTRDNDFTLLTKNRFSCLDDEEILKYEESKSEKERKEIKLEKKFKKEKEKPIENLKLPNMKV